MNITIEKIIKELDRLEELKKMQEMKESKMIEEAVLLMNPKKAKIVKDLNIKYVIFSEACEENKIYSVTDKDLSQAIRKYQDNYREKKNKKVTIYGIKVGIDYLNRYNIKIFENITEKINVDKKDKEEREELIECLKMLKKQAKENILFSDTLIEDVKLDSFNFVIDKAIKFLEAESEEK